MKNENVVIKQSCHSRKFLSGIFNACRCQTKEKTLLNRYVEDPRLRPSGMTSLFNNGLTSRGFTARSVIPQCFNAGYSGRKGFTLIELLVVVLIIGILAAVAVPQYQLMKDKARVQNILAQMRQIRAAEELFYIANGYYTSNFQDLDIAFPGTVNGNVLVTPEKIRFRILDLNTTPMVDVNNSLIYLMLGFKHAPNPFIAEKGNCFVGGTPSTNKNYYKQMKLCKAIGATGEAPRYWFK